MKRLRMEMKMMKKRGSRREQKRKWEKKGKLKRAEQMVFHN